MFLPCERLGVTLDSTVLVQMWYCIPVRNHLVRSLVVHSEWYWWDAVGRVRRKAPTHYRSV